MSEVVLIQTRPRIAATGATVDVRLAGGGSGPYFQLGFGDWRSGIANAPRFTTSIGFDQAGPTGGAQPQTGGFRFFGTEVALHSLLGGYLWNDAPVTITTGDDEAFAPVYAPRLVGTVASVKLAGGALTVTLADLSQSLDVAVCPNTFAGTGDLEGGDDATGRTKRRTFGYAFNIEGRVLDKANNVHEFGDPSHGWQEFKAVKDKGVSYSPVAVVAWQGSALATLNALRATAVADGGVAVAPTIAAAKPWTTPARPLTADVIGETRAGGYTPADIATFLVETFAPTIAVANLAEGRGWINAAAGVHCDNSTETVASVLDRLLAPLLLIWVMRGDGTFAFRRFTWAGPVEALRGETVQRDATFKPLRTRRLGFQLNNRKHSDGEIAANILSGDVVFPDGTTGDDLADAVYAFTSDGILSGGVEKPAEIIRWRVAHDQFTALDAKYVALGSAADLTASRNLASTNLAALDTYLGGLAPPWNDTTTNTPIDPTTYRNKWGDALAAIEAFAAAITGRKGDDALIADTEVPVFAIECYSSGASKPSWTGGSGTIRLTKGAAVITAGVTYSIGAQVNMASLVLTGNAFTFAGITADTGRFDIVATYAGVSYSRTVNVKKVRDGTAAFRGDVALSGTSTFAAEVSLGESSSPIPGGSTVTVSAYVDYTSPDSGNVTADFRGSLAIYVQNVTDGGPLTLLGSQLGSYSYRHNDGTAGEPVISQQAGTVSASFSFASATADKVYAYSARLTGSPTSPYNVTASGRARIEVTA